MSFWDLFRRPERPPGPPSAGAAAVSPDEAPPLVTDPDMAEERLIRGWLSRQNASTTEIPLPPDEPWRALDRLRDAGRERVGLDLVVRLVAARPADRDLRRRLAERLLERRMTDAARPLLDAMAASGGDDVARAEAALASIDAQRGDEPAALRHLEAVLARDLDHPGALERARSIRARLDRRASDVAAPTLVGGADLHAVQRRHRLLRELGRGASSAVYLAHDTEIDRDVALKLLHPHLYGKARDADRAHFFAEARLAAALRAPGVVAVYDVDEGLKLIVMEFCAGGALRGRLRRGRLPAPLAVRRAVQLFAALDLVHAHGVAHGDLKPGNILFRGDADDPEEDLVLADFGTAHLGRDVSEGRPLGGTLGYMAPEARRAGEAGPPADVYAAAVVTWELLAGRLPFTPSEILRGDAHPRIERSAIELADEAAATACVTVADCLRSDPSARPSAAEALARLRAMDRPPDPPSP